MIKLRATVAMLIGAGFAIVLAGCSQPQGKPPTLKGKPILDLVTKMSKANYTPADGGEPIVEYAITLRVTNNTPAPVTVDKLLAVLTNPMAKRVMSVTVLQKEGMLHRDITPEKPGANGELTISPGETVVREISSGTGTPYIDKGVLGEHRLKFAVEVHTKDGQSFKYKTDMPRLDELMFQGRDAALKIRLSVPNEVVPEQPSQGGD